MYRICVYECYIKIYNFPLKHSLGGIVQKKKLFVDFHEFFLGILYLYFKKEGFNYSTKINHTSKCVQNANYLKKCQLLNDFRIGRIRLSGSALLCYVNLACL